MNAPRPSPDSQRIWLTGASSGIGKRLARPTSGQPTAPRPTSNKDVQP